MRWSVECVIHHKRKRIQTLAIPVRPTGIRDARIAPIFVQWRFPFEYLTSGSLMPVTWDSIDPFASDISSGSSIL